MTVLIMLSNIDAFCKEFHVNFETGFLPHPSNYVQRLDDYYNAWEELAHNLTAYRVCGVLEEKVGSCPLLSVSKLTCKASKRRALSLLTFIAHSYIWGHELPRHILPRQLAVPLVELAKQLEVQPLASFASTVLWNYKLLHPDKPVSLNNVSMIRSFTGSTDESWFYSISVVIEARGGRILSNILHAHDNAISRKPEGVRERLDALSEDIEAIVNFLRQTYKHCDAHVFFRRIRPFLAGWKNMESTGLGEGIIYEGVSDTPMSLSGGSNAQSSLIQLLDIALGIRESRGQSSSSSNFLIDQRKYMPGPHRRLLEHLERILCIKEYVLKAAHPPLTNAFEGCVNNLVTLRNVHLQIATLYINNQAHKPREHVPIQPPADPTSYYGLAKAFLREGKGTGGTPMMRFLKTCRDDTRRVLHTNTMSPINKCEVLS